MSDEQDKPKAAREWWIDDDAVQKLLKWLEQCTLAELMLAKEFVENHRGRNQ